MGIEILSSGTTSDLAQRIYSNLTEKFEDISLNEISYLTFANHEIKPKIPQTIRQKDVYLIHSLQDPDPNTSIMQLMLTIDATSRASPSSLTLVLPYMSYSRQDRKDEPRVPISASMIANMIEAYPIVEKIITMDLHCDQIQGFYKIPVDNLYGSIVHADYFKKLLNNNFSNVLVYSPDFGGAIRARNFAISLDESVRTYPIEKKRKTPNEADLIYFPGDPSEKIVLIYDDMIDTGGSIINAAKAAYSHGAKDVYCIVTHGLFSTKKDSILTAEEKFKQAGLKVVSTETIPRSKEYLVKNSSWLTILPLDDILSKAIYESATCGGSISKFF